MPCSLRIGQKRNSYFRWDQFWSILLKRLGYINITYAEWISRWPQWTDEIAAMNKKAKELI